MAKNWVRVLQPNPKREHYLVALFRSEPGEPGVQFHLETTDARKAEAAARHLAEQHNCDWKVMPPLDFDDPTWFDEEGNMRIVDRVEFLALGAGRFQFNAWSGDRMLYSETNTVSEIDQFFDETRLCMEDAVD